MSTVHQSKQWFFIWIQGHKRLTVGELDLCSGEWEVMGDPDVVTPEDQPDYFDIIGPAIPVPEPEEVSNGK